MFDYVDPKNRELQIEMEQACTNHLKKVGAYLEPKFTEIAFDQSDFPVEASVIIPVKNRVKTIADAIRSVLSQKTDLPVYIAEDPLRAVVRGTGICLKNLAKYKSVLIK